MEYEELTEGLQLALELGVENLKIHNELLAGA